MKFFSRILINRACIFATLNVVQVSLGNQTVAACVFVVGSQLPC